MGKVITHDLFIEKLLDKNIYFYNNFFSIKGIYKNMKEKLLVEDKYGEYLIQPLVLLKGSKPSIKCAINKSNQWIKRAKEIHGDKYDYDDVIYNNDYNNVSVTCKIHGNFSIRGSAHLNGQGCKQCYINNIKSNTDIFINKSIVVHSDKYIYYNTEYTTSKNKVNIICKEHGEFLQTPNSHLSGQGCPKCNLLYNSCRKKDWVHKGKNKKGIFYIIECSNENEKFFKLGITFRNVLKRYRINDKTTMPYNYKIIKQIESYDLNYIWDLEKRFKRFKNKSHYIPLIKFKGSFTECFK